MSTNPPNVVFPDSWDRTGEGMQRPGTVSRSRCTCAQAIHRASDCHWSDPSQCDKSEIDDLDAHERCDQTAEAVDEQMPAEEMCGIDWPVLDSSQCERDQGDDNQGIKDDGGKNCALRASQAP